MLLRELRHTNLLEGKPWKVILLFSIPLIAASVLSLLFNIVDSTIIGQIIPDSYAGVSDVGSIYSYVALISDSCAVGFSTVIAKNIGNNDKETARSAFKKSAIISLIFGIIAAICFSFLSTGLLGLLGLNKEADLVTYTSAKIYFLVVTICFPITILNNSYLSSLRALGTSSKPFIFLTLASIVNIILTLAFVLTFKGYEMKVFGAALGTILSQLACLIMTRFYIGKHYSWLNETKKEDFNFDCPITKELLSTALPLMLQNFAMVVSIFVVSKSIISFDNVPGLPASRDVQNAIAIRGKIVTLGCAISAGFHNAIMYFTSQNFGAKKYDRIKKGFKQTLFIMEGCFIFQIIIGLIFTSSRDLIGIFINQSQLNDKVMITIHFMVMAYACCYGFKMITDACSRTLIGLQKSSISLLGTLAELPFRFLIVFGLRYWLFEDIYSQGALILVSSTECITWIVSAIVVSIALAVQFSKIFKKEN